MNQKVKIHDCDYYYDIVAKKITKFREEKDLTQQELADMAHLSMHYISQIESGREKKHFSIEVVGRIADALDIDISEFFKK